VEEGRVVAQQGAVHDEHGSLVTGYQNEIDSILVAGCAGQIDVPTEESDRGQP
jgi:hypothetical protein